MHDLRGGNGKTGCDGIGNQQRQYLCVPACKKGIKRPIAGMSNSPPNALTSGIHDGIKEKYTCSNVDKTLFINRWTKEISHSLILGNLLFLDFRDFWRREK